MRKKDLKKAERMRGQNLWKKFDDQGKNETEK